jgi:hypothetical protein
MDMEQTFTALAAPFPASEVEWRIQRTGEYGGVQKGFAVPYLDSRAISDRLNEVIGQFNWQNSFTAWHTIPVKTGTLASQLCTISIYCAERGEWISKCDGAENTDIEPIKGGLSDAFKRAAVKWNIGRYLYEMSGVWVEVEKKGAGFVIKDGENARLDKVYVAAVAKIFGTTTPKKPAPPPNEAATQTAIITAIAQTNGASGTNTQMQLTDGATGTPVVVYLKGVDEKLAKGVRLKNMKFEEHDNGSRKITLLSNYELAA